MRVLSFKPDSFLFERNYFMGILFESMQSIFYLDILSNIF